MNFTTDRIESFAALGRVFQELTANFASTAIEDEQVRRQILQLLQQETGRLTAINWLVFDPGTQEIGSVGEDWKFTGQAEQALNPVKSQYYSFTLDGKTGKMVYKLTNPQAVSNLAESSPYEFAVAGKKLNCKPGNIQCGGKCQNGKLNCFHGMTPAQKKTAQAAAKAAKKAAATVSSTPKKAALSAPKGGKKAKVATPAPASAATKPTLDPAIKTNDKALSSGRQDLVNRVGQKLVEDAEKNTHKILNDKNVDIFVRVGSSDTLEKILGDRFKGAVELGITNHQIPHLQDKDYTVARKRVETLNGYDKNAKPEDRPISGYFGSSDLKGASHADVSQAYGSIAVKLKPEVKERSTLTGADSFKSGIPSPLNPDGTPPPPSAASIASLTRHGYDLDKLPSGYPSFYKDKTVHQGQLQTASKAKDVNDLVKAGAPTGNAYIEAQIHGKLKPSDIAELHFSPTGTSDRPNAAIASWAKTNGVKIFTNGKEEDLDKLIAPSTKTRAQEVGEHLEKGDYAKVMDYADDVAKRAKVLEQKAPGVADHHLAAIYADAGYDAKPKVVSETDITNEWKNNGGTLMIRGLGAGPKGRTQFFDEFKSGDYFAGFGIYGNGTYVSHAGQPPNNADAKDAWNAIGTRNKYITQNGVTLRMALPKDANVIKQSDLAKEVVKAQNDMDAWGQAERQKIRAANATSASTPTLSGADKAKVTQQENIIRGVLASAFKPKASVKMHSTGGLLDPVTGNSLPSFAYKASLPPSTKGGKSWEAKDFVIHERLMNNASFSAKFALTDTSGNVVSLHKTKADAAKAAIDEQIKKQAFEKANVTQPPGLATLSSTGQKKLADFDARFQRMKDVVFGDTGQDTSGRYATLRGYDAIQLNKSYEPDRFMNLLNRSKVMIQSNELDYKTGLKKVAG